MTRWRRPGDADPATLAEFDTLYQSRYGDIVAMSYVLTGDLGDAQDIAQEAFCRAWQHWGHIVRYDHPITWIRRVATNLACSRWRRLRVVDRHLRAERPPAVPAIGPDRVALVAALRSLPVDHRRALVLHHLVDLSVAEVADELGVPVGTVKSWLHRGRRALAASLGDPAQEVGQP
jgi:RNA polymerase sigma-70 factor (ECF subfamily)